MDAADLVRLATPGDVAGIAALSRDQVEHDLPWRWSPDRVAGCLRDNATARDFYCALGYHERVIVQRRHEDREDGIRLEKWLAVEPTDD